MPKKGYKQTKEHRRNLSESARNRPPISEETRKKLSEAGKGRIVSLETRRKIGEANKNPSLETRKRISEAQKGKKNHRYGKSPSKEMRRKLSKSLKGRIFSLETRKRMSEARKGEKNPLYGKHHSLETRRKISEAHKGKHISIETRKNMSIARINSSYICPQKDTSIEVAMQNELTRRGIIYEKHLPTCSVCKPDISFPQKKVAIFCDGDYWHSKEFNEGLTWARDRKQDRVLRENGWTVYRFWEHEINADVETCVNQINLVIRQKI